MTHSRNKSGLFSATLGPRHVWLLDVNSDGLFQRDCAPEKAQPVRPNLGDTPPALKTDSSSRIPATVQANSDSIRSEEVAREKKTERGPLQSSTPDHKWSHLGCLMILWTIPRMSGCSKQGHCGMLFWNDWLGKLHTALSSHVLSSAPHQVHSGILVFQMRMLKLGLTLSHS